MSTNLQVLEVSIAAEHRLGLDPKFLLYSNIVEG